MKPTVPSPACHAVSILVVACLLSGLAARAAAQSGPPGKGQAPHAVPEPPAATFGGTIQPLSFPKDAPDTAANRKARKAVDEINAVVRGADGEPQRVAEVLGSRMGVFNELAKSPELDARVREEFSDLNLHFGRYEESRGISEVTLKADPDNRDALNHRASASYGLRDYLSAIRDSNRILELEPNDERAYTLRALVHYAEGRFLEAAEDAKKALAINPNNQYANSTFNMARIQLQRASPSLPPAVRSIGDQLVSLESASRQLKSQVEAMGREAAPAPAAGPAGDSLRSRFAAKVAREDYWGAIEEASRVLREDPRHAEAYALRAMAYHMVGDCPKALVDATKAIDAYPLPAAYDARAAALNCLGRPREAVADATRSIAQNGRDADAYALRAAAFKALGDTAAMLADLKKAAELDKKFLADYRAAAAPFVPALPAQASRHGPPAPEAPASPLRRYLVTLAFSLAGGLLIATGLLHLLGPSRRARAAAAAAAGPASGPLHSSYRLIQPIGQGGMGVVYEGVDIALNRKVAVKKMRDEIKLDARERERFLQEARTVAALHHPNIVEIHAILEDAGDTYLIFEFVPGRPLSDWLAAKRTLSLAEARRVCRGVCAALEYAHAHGIVHRDLKPSNIMISAEGEVKVMDFGIARQAKESLSRSPTTTTIVGTPQYMAPEAEQGVVRKESDLYSLGACLYEMLAGQRPFPGTQAAPDKLARNYPKPSRLRAGLPPAVDALIDDALHPDPDRRIRTPAEFLARLERVAEPAAA